MNKTKILVSVIFALFLIGIIPASLLDYFGKITGTVTILASEPEFNVPETMDECKDGGWENLMTLSEKPFKNQGDCVSYVQTHMCEDFELDVFFEYHELDSTLVTFSSFGDCVSYFSSGRRAGAREILTLGSGSGGGSGGGASNGESEESENNQSNDETEDNSDSNENNESEYDLEEGNFSPANNSIFNQSTIEFEINISAPGEGVEIQNVSLLINEIINETNTSRAEGIYSWIVELSDGDYNWSILAFDSNNKSYQSHTRFFSINTTEEEPVLEEPTIIIHYPLNQTYNTSEILLNVSVDGEFNLSSLWYTLDNGETNITFELNETPTLNLSDGIYSLVIYANNTEGNETSADVVFTIETIIPILGCTNPDAINYDLNATKDDGSCGELNETGGEDGT